MNDQKAKAMKAMKAMKATKKLMKATKKTTTAKKADAPTIGEIMRAEDMVAVGRCLLKPEGQPREGALGARVQ